MYGLSMELIYEGVVLGLQHWLNLFEIQNIWEYSGFQAAVDTPEILLLLLLLPYGRINSRMTSYLKIFVLNDFHFQDAIFPFNRAATLPRGC
jgi:hypothetical protein